ncbi:hypothetical protein [Streptomyces sp. HPF1205]|uniref:hypothetical protein n=1 Tax=Streptomyces sp. HPF1205 TaxID=2873262 RepID=UPI001CECAE47|nr:hypothetical protein [Streptomyces sp. HPF1205]
MTSAPARAGSRRERPADPGFARLRAVADAVLYEGYLLYPYRRSSPKNRVRWQFGVLAPREWVEADGPVVPQLAGSAESWRQQTECLFTAGAGAGAGPGADADAGAVVHVRVRYLQVQRKQVERLADDGRYVPVESLESGGRVHLSVDEAVPREADLVVPVAELLCGEREFDIGAPGGEETVTPADGVRVVRTREPVQARTTVRAWRVEPGPGAGSRTAFRLRVRTENTGQAAPGIPREEALRRSLIAAHTFLGGAAVEFVSPVDPPAWAARAAAGCRNLHTFPVLAGAPGTRDLMLSSPIILPDHPQVAPESPGDLHDAAEIDEILSLRTLLLTDEEKREARATDPRAAAILDRVETMPPEVFGRLHGAIRSLRPSQRQRSVSPSPRPPLPEPPSPETPLAGGPSPEAAAAAPWWREGGDEGLSPATDEVVVDGVPVARGSTVRLRPRRRGADAQDMFLDGRAARVEGVFHDVDGSVHLAVTLLDDPAAELHGWYGRFHYFRPDEVLPRGRDGLRPPAAPGEDRPDGRPPAVDA